MPRPKHNPLIAWRVLVLVCLIVPALRAQFVVVTRDAAGSYAFETAEAITVNGEERLRVLPATDDSLQPATYGRLPRVPVSQVARLTRDARGFVAEVTGEEARTAAVVPDGLKLKETTSAAESWNSVVLGVRKDRRSKQETGVRPADLYALLGGLNGPGLGVDFVLDASRWPTHQDQLKALEAAVKAFPPSSDQDRLRLYLEQRLQASLDALEAGGAYGEFLQALDDVAAGERTFPAAVKLEQLRTGVRDRQRDVETQAKALRGLAAAAQWELFLDRFVSFDRYAGSFPDLLATQRMALMESAAASVRRARLLLKQNNPAAAWADVQGALRRSPASVTLHAFAAEVRSAAASRGVTLPETTLDPARQSKAREAAGTAARQLREGQLSAALATAEQVLDPKAPDEDVLYHAGVLAAALRRNDAARSRLEALVGLPVSLDTDRGQRAKARSVLALLNVPPTSAGGTPHWFSGRSLPDAAYYCPESLMFGPRIESVRGNKLVVAFEWGQDGKLQAIKSRYEEERVKQAALARATGLVGAEGTLYFDYLATQPAIPRVSATPPAARPDPAALAITAKPVLGDRGWLLQVPDAPESQAALLHSNPLVNVEVLRSLGMPFSVGFAGNSYFNPFVWEGAHLFVFAHDPQGRVASAAEVGTDRTVRFVWNGDLLQSLTAHGREGDKEEKLLYRRTLSYAGGQLQSETVEHAGRQYRIAYKYAGGRLAEASFEDTGAHDGAARRVKFL